MTTAAAITNDPSPEPTDDAESIDAVEPASWFGWTIGTAASILLFAPLVALVWYFPDKTAVDTQGLTESVGIAVILRATLRRLFRSGSRSVLQTAVGTVMRASARTMTRRIVRVSVKSLAMFLGRSAVESTDDDAPSKNAPHTQNPIVALALGFVVLMASLAGVIYLIDLEQENLATEPLRSAGVLGDMPMAVGVFLGALPLPLYGLLLLAAAPIVGASVKLRTSWEAVLLQAYFTGSGSYLPLATDSEIDGPPWARTRLAFVSLGGLFALHLICTAVGNATGSYAIEYLGAMFLLYAFVFSFPIAPLDGYYIWAQSKLLWAVTWLPLLLCFIWNLPASLHDIL